MNNVQVVRSIENDTVDSLCYRYLGATSGTTEDVLTINPHLASLGPVLPTNTLVTLPTATQAAAQSTFITLWD